MSITQAHKATHLFSHCDRDPVPGRVRKHVVSLAHGCGGAACADSRASHPAEGSLDGAAAVTCL